MTFNEWLYQATLGMTDQVRARVQAETLAHVQDAGLNPDEDVQELLGSPRKVNRQLRKLYLTRVEYQRQVVDQEQPEPRQLLRKFLWVAFPFWILFGFSQHLPGHLAWIILALVCILALHLLTARLPGSRRELWRLSAVTVTMVGFAVSTSPPFSAVFVMILAVGSLIEARLRDQKLKRTLALEAQVGSQR